MLAYSGVAGFETSSPFTNSTELSITTSTLTTTTANSFVISIFSTGSQTARTWTPPVSTNVRGSVPNDLSYNGLLIVDELRAAGVSVARTATVSSNFSVPISNAVQIAMIPTPPQTISFVGAGAVVTGTFPTVPIPSGVVEGDLLLLVYTVNSPASFTPSGWTKIGTQNIPGFPYDTSVDASRAPNQHFYYRFARANEPAVSLSYISFNNTTAVIVAYRGVSDIDVVGSFTSATNTSPSTLSQTTAFDNEYIVSVFSRNIDTTPTSTWTVPSGVSERVKSEAISNNGLLIVDELQTSAGSTAIRTATLQNSRFWASGSISLRPIGITSRNLYWVGGSQLWNTTAGTNWSTTSGGSGGELSPTAADNVYFDSNSGSSIVNIVAGVANNLVCTGFTGTLAGPGSLKVYGDFTLNSTMTYSYVGTLMFATSTVGANRVLTNRNITTAGHELYSVDFNHVSGRWTLVDNLTVTTEFRLTSGTLNANSKTITCSKFISVNEVTRQFLSIAAINITGNNSFILHFVGRYVTGINNRTINLTYAGSVGTRQIYLPPSDSGFSSEYFNLNVTAGSDVITMAPSGRFSGQNFGRISVNNLNFTGFTGTLDLTAASGNRNSVRSGPDLTFTSSMTVIPGTTSFALQGTSPQLNLAGHTLFRLTLNNSGTALLNSNMILLDALQCAGSSFNANNYNVTIGSFLGRAQSGNFNMGNGTWTLTGTGEIWRNDTAESNAAQWLSGASTIVISDTSSSSKTFLNYGGHSSLSYNAIRIAGGAGTGSVIFSNRIAATVSRLGIVTSTRTAAYTITLPSNTTTVVTSWLADGANSSNRIRLNSSTAGTQATLSQPSGEINVFNMIIQDIAAAGCARFNANTSQNAGNNTGWGFGGAVPPERCAFNFFLVF
jgi:hypothetical protein